MREAQQQQQERNALRQYGSGILAGDPNAFNAAEVIQNLGPQFAPRV